jgi:Uma2 family endonuclease
MAIFSKDGVELRLPDHTDLPDSDQDQRPKFPFRVPDHTDLPDSDGEIVENMQELPQALLLSDSVRPILRRRHPGGQFCIGSNSGIYWDLTEPTHRGVVAPDWFYVPNVSPGIIDGGARRSYVMWKEVVPPLIVLEFVTGDGRKERDRTPRQGNFWIYEKAIRADYYGIFEVEPDRLELYERVDGAYQLVPVNDRGHFPVGALGIELGIWQGHFFGLDLPWLRWWDDQGNLLLTNEERNATAELELIKARERADALAAKLKELGIDPDKV